MIDNIQNSIDTLLSGLSKQLEDVKPNENPHPAAMFRFQLEAFARRIKGELVPGAVFEFFHPITLRVEAFVTLCGPDTVTVTTHGHGMWIRNADPRSDAWSLSKSVTIAKKLGALIRQQEEFCPSVPGFHVLFDPEFEKTPALNYDFCNRNVNTLSKVSYFDTVETDNNGNVVVPKAVMKTRKPSTPKASTKSAKSAEALVAEAEALVAAVSKAKAKGKGKGKATKKTGSKAKATPAKAETKPAKKGAKAATKTAAKATPKARKGQGKSKKATKKAS